jgi:hypothetical protein
MLKRVWVLLLAPLILLAQRPWQEIVSPRLQDAAANFRTPPREYDAIHWAIWGGELTRERIVREFDSLERTGIHIVNFGPARGMNPPYLSPQHLELTMFAVAEAAKRGMKVWLADKGSYPSGFAGGRISTDYPELRMQGLVADVRVSVAPGQTISMPVTQDTLAAMISTQTAPGRTGAPPAAPAPNEPVAIQDGRIQWTAPPDGRHEIIFIRHVFRSSPTRYINRADGTYSQDSLYSLIDYLNPEATRAFLKTTHEVYKSLFGDEFGKTILGFFGDEPDYIGFMPWTPALLEQFRQIKGYDLQPYLATLFGPTTPGISDAWRVKADYWDVWSGIFSKSFFGTQADWCAQNRLEYLVHLNHEELMFNLSRGEDLIRNEGDFFRYMRYVQVPGVDNLSQLRPDLVNKEDLTYATSNNFPKLASSAAHLFGRPKAWSEEGGVRLGVDGKFQLDYQLVEGMTALQLQGALGRGPGGGSAVPNPEAPAGFSLLAAYANRAGYLMSIGRPAVQVALYHPASSMWLGDEEADRSTTKLSKQLLEHQIDFDYIDEQSLSSVAALEKGGFRNLSGQVYRAVIVPSSSVISQVSLDRLRAFAASGGKVLFVGKMPGEVATRTFLHPSGAPDLTFGMHEAAGAITAAAIAALPKPDVVLDKLAAALQYTHRTWADADLYFVFNESNEEVTRVARLDGRGQAQVWDLATGLIHPMRDATSQPDGVRVPLTLAPYEARVIVIGPMPADVANAAPSLATRKLVMDLGGNSSAPGTYRKEFTLAAKPAAGRLWLECGEFRDAARVKVNGTDLAEQAWRPYRWDVTDALKTGANIVEIEVKAIPEGRAPAGAAPVPVPAVTGSMGPVQLVSYE